MSELRGVCLCAAAATAVLINKQGSPLEGAIFWAVETGFTKGSDGDAPVLTAKIASQGCAPFTQNTQHTKACIKFLAMFCRTGDALQRAQQRASSEIYTLINSVMSYSRIARDQALSNMVE